MWLQSFCAASMFNFGQSKNKALFIFEHRFADARGQFADPSFTCSPARYTVPPKFILTLAGSKSLMQFNALAIGLVLLTTYGVATAKQAEEVDPRVAAFNRQISVYEETNSSAVAYHAARLAMALRRFDDAEEWIAVLASHDWKLGLDPMDFHADQMPSSLRSAIARLQAAVPKNEPASSAVLTLEDRSLIPESVAYSFENKAFYAGSLASPRLNIVPIPNDSWSSVANIEFDMSTWGVFYGLKFHDIRNELWVLHNRTQEDGMTGRLSVLTPEGRLLRQYSANDVPAVELNDLCFTDQDVYVTDSTASRIYRGDLEGGSLILHYEHPDIRYPNGIACGPGNGRLYVAHAFGMAAIDADRPTDHVSLEAPKGFSLGGIDGLYLWGEGVVGVQNYLGAPKILVASLKDSTEVGNIRFFDVNHSQFHIPTTGFVRGDCLYYIANSFLDALRGDDAIDPAANAEAAQILGLNLRDSRRNCQL